MSGANLHFPPPCEAVRGTRQAPERPQNAAGRWPGCALALVRSDQPRAARKVSSRCVAFPVRKPFLLQLLRAQGDLQGVRVPLGQRRPCMCSNICPGRGSGESAEPRTSPHAPGGLSPVHVETADSRADWTVGQLRTVGCFRETRLYTCRWGERWRRRVRRRQTMFVRRARRVATGCSTVRRSVENSAIQ